jgi:hypothetical protein
MIFSENRYALFRIMRRQRFYWTAAPLNRFAREKLRAKNPRGVLTAGIGRIVVPKRYFMTISVNG